jgi:hypothetical protein
MMHKTLEITMAGGISSIPRSSNSPISEQSPAPAHTPPPARSERASVPQVLSNLPALSSRPRVGTPAIKAGPSARRSSLGDAAALQRTASPDDGSTASQQLETLVANYFKPHETDENREQIRALVLERTRQLLAMGETAKSVGETFTKASRMDAVSQAAAGFLGSMPFAAATLVQGAAPDLTNFPTPFQSGAAGGAVSHVFDAAGGKMLEKARSNTQWLSADADKLAPVMADAKQASAPGTLRTHLENAVAIQTFTARNLARTVTNTVLTHASGAATAGRVDLWMSAAGSPLAGAAYNLAMHHAAQQNHRVGPEFLLGREDWADRYTELKAATWSGAAANGIGRLARIPFDAATSATDAAQSLFKPTSLAQGTALAVGFGAVGAAVTAAADVAAEHHVSATGTAAIKQGVQTLGAAGVFPLWTSAGLAAGGLASTAGAAVDTAGDAVGRGASAAANATMQGVSSARSAVVQGVPAAAGWVSSALDSTLNATGLRRRFPPARATPPRDIDLEALGTQLPPPVGEAV